jgi:hypothetical protein
VFKNAAGNWDEPPDYPALTNSYYQALEMGKDIILAPIVHAKTHEEAMQLAVEKQNLPGNK